MRSCLTGPEDFRGVDRWNAPHNADSQRAEFDAEEGQIAKVSAIIPPCFLTKEILSILEPDLANASRRPAPLFAKFC